MIILGLPGPPKLHFMREVTLTNESVLFISIRPPNNINEIDLEFYEIKEVSSNVTLKLTNETTQFLFVLPLIGGSTQIRAVAVDRCDQRGIASSLNGKLKLVVNPRCMHRS